MESSARATYSGAPHAFCSVRCSIGLTDWILEPDLDGVGCFYMFLPSESALEWRTDFASFVISDMAVSLKHILLKTSWANGRRKLANVYRLARHQGMTLRFASRDIIFSTSRTSLSCQHMPSGTEMFWSCACMWLPFPGAR